MNVRRCLSIKLIKYIKNLVKKLLLLIIMGIENRQKENLKSKVGCYDGLLP